MTDLNTASLREYERREAEYQRKIDAMPIVGTCCICGEPIRGSTYDIEGDTFVPVNDGDMVHLDDCWTEYGIQNSQTE